jgi:predicted ester cyclase
MSSSETNKATVLRFFKAVDQNNMDGALACWKDDAINHGRFSDDDPREKQIPQGKTGLRAVFDSLRTAFPDRQNQIMDIFTDGDKVACRLRASGTHGAVPAMPVEGGPLLQAIQPANRPYSIGQIHIFRMENGLIAEHWAARDDLYLLEQLGGLPVPTRKAA